MTLREIKEKYRDIVIMYIESINEIEIEDQILEDPKLMLVMEDDKFELIGFIGALILSIFQITDPKRFRRCGESLEQGTAEITDYYKKNLRKITRDFTTKLGISKVEL